VKRAKWENTFFDCPLINLKSKERAGSVLVSASQRGAWLWHARVYQTDSETVIDDNGPFTISHSCGLRLCEAKSRTAATKLINKFHKDGFGDVAITVDGVSPQWSNAEARKYFQTVSTLQATALGGAIKVTQP